MLSQLKSKLMDADLTPSQLKYIREIEANAIKRVEDILSPVLGQAFAVFKVAADVDFSPQANLNGETHRPNATPQISSSTSQQTSESASTMPSARACRARFQPTAGSGHRAVDAAGGSRHGRPRAKRPRFLGKSMPPGFRRRYHVGQPINTRKDSTINYEVDRTIRHTKQPIGTIKRLTAAVVV